MSAKESAPLRSLSFSQHLGFRKILTERVDTYMRAHKLRARDLPQMYMKTGVVMAWWLVTYLLIILGGFSPLINAILCVVWALAIGAIGFNVMHDANHGSFSSNPRINKLMCLSAEFLGISGFRWRTKHNVWHHTYTNITGMDDDIQAYGFMRLSPHDKWRPLHRLQALYFPIVYSLIGFDFIMRDFAMVISGKSDASHVYPRMSAADKAVFWLGKAFFFGVMIVVPLLVFPWWQVLIGFMIVLLTVGLTLGIIFQLAHVQRTTTYPEPTGIPLHIDNEWAIHQVETTANFAPGNRLLNLYIGGLNYQIEHHLLPHISHIHYARLAPIVKQTCDEFGVRYNSFKTWRAAFANHWLELKTLAREY